MCFIQIISTIKNYLNPNILDIIHLIDFNGHKNGVKCAKDEIYNYTFVSREFEDLEK